MEELNAAMQELADVWYRFQREMGLNMNTLDSGLLRLQNGPTLYGPTFAYWELTEQNQALQAAMDRMYRALVAYYSDTK